MNMLRNLLLCFVPVAILAGNISAQVIEAAPQPVSVTNRQQPLAPIIENYARLPLAFEKQEGAAGERSPSTHHQLPR